MLKIDLISDTVTKPTPGMLEAMFKAEVGDDVFGEDPTIRELEERMADMFGKPEALFCPSGTMTNQIAIKCHTQPLDELICEEYSHVYQYEVGGYGFNSGIGIQLLKGENGKITAEQVEAAIRPDHDWLPVSKLVVLENSCNKGGGSYYTLDEIRPISDLCSNRGLKTHLDGARLFNVLVKTKESTRDVGKYFDSISICLSKGLGAPAGSVLIGNKNFIRQARRTRKVMGGGMRQVGYLAAACLYALDHHIDRLAEDNARAERIGRILGKLDYIHNIRPVHTNIIIFDLGTTSERDRFIDYLKKNGIRGSAFGPATMRFVTHLGITDEMIDRLESVLMGFNRHTA